MRSWRGLTLIVVVLTLAGALGAAPSAPAQPPHGPVVFRAEPVSQPVYGIAPETHKATIEAADGTPIFIETWLPAPNGEHVPPERVPVVVSISPYLAEGTAESGIIRSNLVPRGYAYANVHVRGTGESGGCLDLFGPTEADDSARALEYLGRDAPFSDGNLGAYGVSYPGGTPLSVAGRGDPEMTQYLKAMVVGAPYHAGHEAHWTFDGVASFATPLTMPLAYLEVSYAPEEGMPPPDLFVEKAGCQPGHLAAGADWSGNHTPWHQARDNRAWTGNITTPTFVFHGHADLRPMGGSPPSIQRGLFDELPATTPKVGVFGVFGHSMPQAEHPEVLDMVVAWFDRWLKGADVPVHHWPTVHVQGTDGQWRTEADWPTTGGPVGHLALGPDGSLGVPEPDGTTVYVEGAYETTLGRVPATSAVFETAPLPDRLELTGQPVLDLWVTLAVPDAHVAARLEVLDAAGDPIDRALTYGLRSAQHLEPFTDGRFTQTHPTPPPVGVPVRVPVRFQPTDLVVPPGGTLRLTVAGSLIVNPGLEQLGVPEPIFLGPSSASGVVAPVTIHHDCATPSALRFALPHEDSRPIVFEEPESRGRPHQAPPAVTDGGGLATAPVCGETPLRIDELGPERPMPSAGGGRRHG